MKKVIVILSALVITGAAAQAQKTTFGIKAGIQESSFGIHIKSDEAKATIDGSKIGAIVGGVADISFSDKFSIQPNLLFVYKPGSLLFLGEGDIQTISVDLPINFLYHNNGFFAGAGPNISYGLSSKYKPFDDDDEDVDMYKKEDGNDATLKRFEMGVNAILGYQFASGLTLTTNYTHGLSNIMSEDLVGEDAKFHTKHFGISIGYMFNNGKKK